jgi:hypothetical protein
MYIDKGVFWTVVVILAIIFIYNIRLSAKRKQILIDLGEAFNNSTQHLIASLWLDEKSMKNKKDKKKRFELVVNAIEQGTTESVAINHSYLDSGDILACCRIFNIGVRNPITKVTPSVFAERNCKKLDEFIREDLGNWLNFDDYENYDKKLGIVD